MPKLENGWLFQSASINQNTEFPVERTLDFPLTRVTAALLSARILGVDHMFICSNRSFWLCYTTVARVSHIFLKDFFYFLERGREGERGRETSIGCLSYAPSWASGLQPRHVPWLGFEPAAFQFTGRHSIHWANQPGQPRFLELVSKACLQ